jgi:hypothetical protein
MTENQIAIVTATDKNSHTLSYRGRRLSKAGEALGITLQPSAGGHGGTFIPEGIRWVVDIVQRRNR